MPCGVVINGNKLPTFEFKRLLLAGEIDPVEAGLMKPHDYVDIDGRIMVRSREGKLVDSNVYKGLEKDGEALLAYDYIKENEVSIMTEYSDKDNPLERDKNNEIAIYRNKNADVTDLSNNKKVNDVINGEGYYIKNQEGYIKIADKKNGEIIITDEFKDSVIRGEKRYEKLQAEYIKHFELLQEMMPYITIEEVTDETTTHPGAREYIDHKTGIIYYNKDRIDSSTPFHTAQHIWTEIVKRTNPELYERMSDWAKKQAAERTPLYEYVMKDYPDLTGDDLVREMLSKLAEFVSEDVYHFQTNDRNYGFWDTVKNFVTEWFDTIKTFFRKITGTYGHPLERLSKTYNLDLESCTIEELVTAMMEDVSSGNFFTIMSSKELALQLDKTLFQKGQSRVDKTTDFKSILSFSGEEKYDNDRRDKNKVLADNVVKFIKKAYVTGHSLSEKETQRREAHKSIWGRPRGKDVLNRDKSDYLLRIMGSSNNVARIDEIEKHGLMPINPKIFSSSSLTNKDEMRPVVVIKNGEKASNGVLMNSTVNMFYITNSPNINKEGREPITKNLFRNYISNSEASRIGFMFMDTEAGYHNFLLTLQAIELLSKNPSTRIGSIGTIGIGSGTVYQSFFSLHDGLKVIKELANNEKFMDQLEPYMRSVFKHAEKIRPETFDDIITTALKVAKLSTNTTYSGTNFHVKIYNAVSAFSKNQNYETKQALLELVNARLSFMKQKIYKGDVKVLAQDPEAQEYIKLATYLHGVLDKDLNNYESIKSSWNTKLRSIPDIRHPILRGIAQHIRLGSDKIVQEYERDFEAEFNNLVADVYKQWRKKPGMEVKNWTMEKIKEMGSEAFKHLFKTVEIEVETNKGREKKEAVVPYLHWDKNDTETQKLINEKKLTEKDLEFTNFILDKVRESLIEAEHAERHWLSRQQAEELVDKYLDRGHIGTFSKSINELIFSNFWEGKNKFFKKLKGYNAMSDELYDVEESFGKRHMQTPFKYQFTDYDNHLYSLGIYREADGTYKFVSPDGDWTKGLKKNQEVSTNLDAIARTIVKNAKHKTIWNRDIFPAIESTEMFIRMMENKAGINQQWVIDMMDQYANRMGFGMGLEPGGWGEKGKDVKLNPGIRMAMNLMATSFIATNPKVWLAVTVGNMVRTGHFALSNYFTEHFAKRVEEGGGKIEGVQMDWFTAKELAKAQQLLITDLKKIVALDHLYKLTERDEDQLLTNARNRYTKKMFYHRNYMGYLMRHSDIANRRIAMVAQMLKEGTYDAHVYNKKTGKIEIDITKDKRYRNGKGEIATEDDKMLFDYYQDKMQFDKRIDENGKWNWLYTIEDQQRLMWLSDRFCVGTYSHKDRFLIDDHNISKLFTQFKFFWANVLTNKFSKEYEMEFGKDKIFEQEVYDENGQMRIIKYAANEKYLLEGQYNSFFRYFKDVIKMIDGEHNWYEKLGHAIGASAMEVKDILFNPSKSKLSEQKYNQIQNIFMVTSELASGVLLTLLWSLLWNYDDDIKGHEKSQFYRGVRAGIAQLIPMYNVWEITKAVEAPSAVLSTFADLIGMVGEEQKRHYSAERALNFIPGRLAYKFFTDEETGIYADIQRLYNKIN